MKPDIEELVGRFDGAFSFVAKNVHGREAETNALKLAMLTGQHILLQGLPGIAKSLFATLAFKIVSDAKVFTAQLHGNLLSDHILGVANPKRLREDGVLEINTSGMLPEAHFAYLDELFRAAPTVLDSTLSILNERRFFNAGRFDKVPLLTAVATTNKIVDDEDTQALLDRFLIIRAVKPAESDKERDAIIRIFMAQDDAESLVPPSTITLSELRYMQARVRAVEIPEEFSMIVKFARNAYVTCNRGVYISDRRWCWVHRALQAAIFLRSSGLDLTEPDYEAAGDVAAVLARSADHLPEVEKAIAQGYTTVVKTRREREDLESIQERVAKMVKLYDPSLPSKRKMVEYQKTRTLVQSLTGGQIEASFTLQEYRDKATSLASELLQLQRTYEKDLNLSTRPSVPDTNVDDNYMKEILGG